MTIDEFVKITKGESISKFDPEYSLGEWVEHVFSHYGDEHQLGPLAVYGIVYKNDTLSINTRYTEFNGERFILIDERYIEEIVRSAESIVTGFVPLRQALCTSQEFINEYEIRSKRIKNFDEEINLYPKFGLLWNGIDEDELTHLIEEIIMKFMISHEIHHVLIDNGFIKDEDISYNFKGHVGFDAIDDAIDYINEDPTFAERFSDKQLLIELNCDQHALNLTWRDIVFSRGECNPVIITIAIALAFSAMKFHFAKYHHKNIEANVDIQIRDLYVQALCTSYCDRFIYVANYHRPRDERIDILRVITPYYEQLTLIIYDLALCYFALVCKILKLHNLPVDFERISLNFVLLQTDKETATTYRNDFFEVTNNLSLSVYIDRALMLYDEFFKETPFHQSTFHISDEITEQNAGKYVEHFVSTLEVRNQFITIFNNLKKL